MKQKDVRTELLRFIDRAPTPYHVVREVTSRLSSAGFTAWDERDEWAVSAGDRGFVVRGGGSVIAFRIGEKPPAETGFRILGAHTDSPNLKIKPSPDLVASHYRQIGVEVYGGVLWATWLDRDLSLAGRVCWRGGRVDLIDLRVPVCRIPSLAIHLDRGVNDKGMALNAQSHLIPILGSDGLSGGVSDLVLRALSEQGRPVPAPEALLGFDLSLYDTQPSALGGDHEELIYAPRLDNLASCHAAIEAILHARATTCTQVVVLYDHEEVGSQSSAGARSRFVLGVLERLAMGFPGASHQAPARALAGSYLVSVDMAHAIHPNHPNKHDKQHRPLLGHGPVIKVNAGQAYATDGPAASVFAEACQEAGCQPQRYVSRNDLPCGSTVGPISAARLGIRTVDVGNPMLSMHSCREMAGATDVPVMISALTHILQREQLPASAD